MARSIEWMKLTAAEVQAAAAEDALLIIPVASLEQHGPALVTGTDIILGGNVALETARKLVAAGHPALVTPVVWHGLAEHHMAFGGTVTLDSATFQAVLRHVVKSAARHGFKRVFLMNGHGGNAEAIGTAATDLAVEFGIRVGGGTYWHMVPEVIAPLLQDQPTLMHACEAETSMMMAIQPGCVRTENIARAVPTRFAPPAPPGFKRTRPFAEMTDTGVLGDPRSASAAKGERLFDAAAARLAEELARPELWG